MLLLQSTLPNFRVKTNKEQLERILLYLLKNAAFYTEQGRISLEFKNVVHILISLS